LAFGRRRVYGAIAQLGERVLCKHEVVGSIPSGSTSSGERRQDTHSAQSLAAFRFRSDAILSVRLSRRVSASRDVDEKGCASESGGPFRYLTL
jgi:hypothetical protein